MAKKVRKICSFIIICCVLLVDLSGSGYSYAEIMSDTAETTENAMKLSDTENGPDADIERAFAAGNTADTVDNSELSSSSEVMSGMGETVQPSTGYENMSGMEGTAESSGSTPGISETPGVSETTDTVEVSSDDPETETLEESESDDTVPDDTRIIIQGFTDFDPYGQTAYRSVTIGSVDGKRTYLVLPAAITMVTSDNQNRTISVNANWRCDDWENPDLDSYTFTLDFDAQQYCLDETLSKDIEEGRAVLPYVDVKVQSSVTTRSMNPNPEIPTTVVNRGLIYIPGTSTSTYDFLINGKRAYCLQHPIPSAANGQVLTPAIYDNADIQKVLYYGYDGVKPYSGFTSEAAGIVMTSLALSYFYMGDYNFAPTWAGGAYGSYSRSLGFDKFLDFIKAQPYDSGASAMSFSKNSVKAYVDNGIQRTENIMFNYVENEYIDLPLQTGVTLVNITRNTQTGSSATIYGGDTFYLKAPASLKGTWQSQSVTGSKGKFAPIICLTGASTQDIGYGEWVEDTEKTISLSVEWTGTRDASILKRDSKTGKALAGAKLRLTDASGNVLDTWTSTEEAHKIASLEIGKSYTLTELAAPGGYLMAAPVSFTVTADSGELVVFMDNIPTEYEFNKLDIAGNQMLVGAILKVSEKKSGKVVAQWQSGQSGYRIDRLVADNSYVFSEVTPAPGYTTAASIEFIVSKNAGVQTVTMVDDYTKIEFLKLDITKKTPVKGAQLQLADSDGQVLDTWVTDGSPHQVTKLVVGKTYTLKELKPAQGYVTAARITFTVRDTNDVQTIEMLDDYTKVDILKTDLATGKPVAGARLAVYPADESGKAVTDKCCATWISTEGSHRIDYLPIGNYILRETQAPGTAGYVTAEDVPFSIGDNGAVVKVEMKDDHTRLEVIKTDAVTGKTVTGARLAIYPVDSKGQPNTENCLDEWISEEKPHQIEYIPVGKYILRELEPPVKDGYVTSMDIEFTVEDKSDMIKVEMKDAYTVTEISKVDKESRECIAGAHLKLVDSEGNVVDEWLSEDKPHEILRLKAGEQYELIETAPPDGYTTAENVKFVVQDTPNVQEIIMEDSKTQIIIDKKDKEQGKALAGAHLKLVDEENNVIDEWISGEEGHCITMLVVGKTYILKETQPPEGYATAADIEFVVADTPKVQQLSMSDGCTKLSFEKVDARTKARISGAKMQLKDKEGSVVASWTSEEAQGYYIEKLGAGREYTVEEVSAPENYELMDAMTITVADSSELQTFFLGDEPAAAEQKAFISPKTGDDMPLGLVAALTGISLAGAVAIGVKLKKRPHK